MAAGRPTLYREEYCEELVVHMTNGKSFESFAGVIGTCRSILYDWVRDHPAFSDAKKRGTAACLNFWESKGIEALDKDKFQSAIWIFNMKARFRWADQIAVQVAEDPAEDKYSKLSLQELAKIALQNPENK